MTERPRDISRYLESRRHHQHGSISDVAMSRGLPGVHSFAQEGMAVDLLYDERPGNSILVFFSAAAGVKRSWPYFSGIKVAKSAGLSILSISDPSISLGTNIETGWTLGDARYPFHKDVLQLVSHFAGERKVIFVGSSAGGFAALHFGAQWAESYSVVINPRTHLLTPPTHINKQREQLYGDIAIQELHNVIPVRPANPENTVLYLQNSGDARYFSGHMIPYLLQLESDTRVWTQLPYWGEGHVAMPPNELADLVSKLASSHEEALRGFIRFNGVEDILRIHASLSAHNEAPPQ